MNEYNENNLNIISEKKDIISRLIILMNEKSNGIIIRGSFALLMHDQTFKREIGDLDITYTSNSSLSDKISEIRKLMNNLGIEIKSDVNSIVQYGYFKYKSKYSNKEQQLKIDAIVLNYKNEEIENNYISTIINNGLLKLKVYSINILFIEKFLSLSRFFYMNHKFDDDRWIKSLYDIGQICNQVGFNLFDFNQDRLEKILISIYMEQSFIHTFYNDPIVFSSVFRTEEYFINLNTKVLIENYNNYCIANKLDNCIQFNELVDIIYRFATIVNKYSSLEKIENEYLIR